MMFGRYEDEDIREEGEEKPHYGLETGGMWLSRRRSRGEKDDDDDDDEDEEASTRAEVKEKGKGRWFQRQVSAGRSPSGDGECAHGLEELQLGQSPDSDIPDIPPVPSDKLQA